MHEDPSDGHFADIRDMEDHPEQFMAEDKARAASAGIVLDYHLGKRLPNFLLTHLKPSPTTQNKKKKKASSESSSGGGGVGEDIGAAAAGRAKAHESGTIPASEVAAAAAADEAFAAARDCTSLTSFYTSTPGESYRMVHVVRNPVEVLISAGPSSIHTLIGQI